MKILITRPEPDASLLAASLPHAEKVVLPLLDIKLLNHSSFHDQGHELIFVSKNAVLGFTGTIPNTPCFAVGSSTAAALKHKGFQQVTYPINAEGSEALLALPELQNVRGRRFTIICGVDSRDHIEKTLNVRGAKIVSHLITYQTHFRNLDAAELACLHDHYNLLIVTSSHAMRHLAKLAATHNPKLFATPITVLAGNMLKSATLLGFTQPLIVKSFANEHLRYLAANPHSR